MAQQAEKEQVGAALPESWWRDGVLYQVYPRSFADSDGDGIGDLRGVIARLDHLEWLGIDGIWLNPTMPSPNKDWGYDVADYCAVHPDLGTMEDLEALIAAAAERGIKVLLDLVPNHTSDQHAWFQDALTGRDARHRDFYVWADPKPDGSPPNNWRSNFGGSAWQLDEASGQMYLHNFLPEQPDLNWWNDEVRDAFDGILRFWYDRGIAGFRIDVTHAIIKDRELRDNPAATPDDHQLVRDRGFRQVFSMNRPEVHDVLRRWRSLSSHQDPERILVGETYVLDLDHLIPFYGGGEDELHLAFNFIFVHAPLSADALRTVVEGMEEKLPARAWPVYTGSNHDAGRLATRWADGDERRARTALTMLLTLRGTRSSTTATRSGSPTCRSIRRPRSTRSRTGPGTRTATATSAARRCSGAASRARASRRRTRSPGCRSATTRRATSPPSAPTAARRCTSSATSSRCVASVPACARATTRRSRRRTARGRTGAATR
jgi:alpha-glucosidase